MRLDLDLGGSHALSRRTTMRDGVFAPAIIRSYGGRFVGRHRTFDMLTFDAARAFDGRGNAMGKPLGGTFTTHDGKVVDSTGAFLVGELERLDPKFHGPLVAVSWQRDIDLRSDVTVADDVSSFTLTTFGSVAGAGGSNGVGQGISWAGRSSTQVTGVSIDISKKTYPLTPWSSEIAFTVFELESAARVGRPVD